MSTCRQLGDVCLSLGLQLPPCGHTGLGRACQPCLLSLTIPLPGGGNPSASSEHVAVLRDPQASSILHLIALQKCEATESQTANLEG